LIFDEVTDKISWLLFYGPRCKWFKGLKDPGDRQSPLCIYLRCEPYNMLHCDCQS